MKVGEIKDAIQEMSNELQSIRLELFQTKCIAYRLMTGNIKEILDDSKLEMIANHKLGIDIESMMAKWFKK